MCANYSLFLEIVIGEGEIFVLNNFEELEVLGYEPRNGEEHYDKLVNVEHDVVGAIELVD